uniref:Uncharacterized protein n=1 Tax=Anguilla anguilla TaxID=7936 RepID=A0A0E9SAB6_ANGAN
MSSSRTAHGPARTAE